MISTRRILLTWIFCLIQQIWAVPTESSAKGGQKDTFHILPMVLMKWFHLHLDPQSITYQRINQQWVPFFANSMPLSKELFLCPAETEQLPEHIEIANATNTDPEKEEIIDHCLFVKNFTPWETKECRREATPIIEPKYIRNENDPEEKEHISCGPGGIGKLYSVQYELCIVKQDDWMDKILNYLRSYISDSQTSLIDVVGFELYSFCYDHTRKETIYTEHSVLSPGLFQAPELSSERERGFPMSTEGFDQFGSDFEIIKDAYSELENLSIEVERLTSPNLVDIPLGHDDNEFSFVPQKLVPDMNMAFALSRKTTFHYANIRPFFKTLARLWEIICQHIKTHTEQNLDHQFEIFTGAFRTSQERSDDKLIGGQISIPEFWITVVEQTILKQGIAIIVSDYIDDVLESYCKKSVCAIDIPDDVRINPERYVRCCQITQKVEQLFGLEFQTKDILNINGIVDQNDSKFFESFVKPRFQ